MRFGVRICGGPTAVVTGGRENSCDTARPFPDATGIGPRSTSTGASSAENLCPSLDLANRPAQNAPAGMNRSLIVARPTDEAAEFFELAAQAAGLAEMAAQGTTDRIGGLTAIALRDLAKGLQRTNAGLRATYVLLEAIRNSLPRPGR
jgi:hypothetical protein